MLNNSVKFFLIFLSIYTTSPAYSMEEEERNNHPLRDFFARQVAKSGFVFTREQQQANFDFEKIMYFSDRIDLQETKKTLEKIDKTLQQGANIDRINFEGKTWANCILGCYSFNYQLLEHLLKRGANPNFSGYNRRLPTLLYVAVNYSHNINVMKLLIKYGTDIEYRNNNDCTLLGHIIIQDWANKAIKQCCKLKASLINVDHDGRSALHLAIIRQHPIPQIKTILTNARFDQEEIDDEELDKQLKEAAISTLLVLKKFYIPEDLQFSVLDELTSMHDIQGFNQILSQFLFKNPKNARRNNLIIQAKKRNNEFKKIAESKDRNGHSALDRLDWLLTSPILTENQYAQSIQPLLTGKQYDDDITEFIKKKGKVSKENLVLAPLYN